MSEQLVGCDQWACAGNDLRAAADVAATEGDSRMRDTLRWLADHAAAETSANLATILLDQCAKASPIVRPHLRKIAAYLVEDAGG